MNIDQVFYINLIVAALFVMFLRILSKPRERVGDWVEDRWYDLYGGIYLMCTLVSIPAYVIYKVIA